MDYVELYNGVHLPLIGYGTLQIAPGQVKHCVLKALDAGYRMIDTAAAYFNEKGIGEAIKESEIDRSKIFIITKVWIQDAGYIETKKAFKESLKNLDVDYIDLYLIHQPFGDYYGAWRAMEELYQQGKVKAIGVCNFTADRFVDLCMNCQIKPMINQIEFHPFFQQDQMFCILQKYNCQLQAWGPLAEGQKGIFENEILKSIADKHHKTIAQIVLRWHIQNQRIVIPKTVHEERIIENINIWDFELDEEDLEMISKMNIGYSEIIDHQSYKTAKWLNQYKIHK